jgi:hypothetical protein
MLTLSIVLVSYSLLTCENDDRFAVRFVWLPGRLDVGVGGSASVK